MYKLFLCLRYLKRRVMAYFAVLSVALCVAMMLIVVSVMDGFLSKIETAAKGLSGDIIVESGSLGGLAMYDDFIAELKQKMPGTEASPFITTIGMIRIPDTSFSRNVQIAGIRLPQRARISDIPKGLFVQKDWPEPTFDPPPQQVLQRLKNDSRQMLQDYISKGNAVPKYLLADFADEPWAKQAMAKARATDDFDFNGPLSQISTSLDFRAEAKAAITHAEQTEKELQQKRAQREQLSQEDKDTSALDAEIAQLRRLRLMPPQDRVILGLGIPSLSIRTKDGKVIRYIVPGNQIDVTVWPLGRKSLTGVTPTTWTASIIDDLKTDVYIIDSNTIYVPFESLQRMNEMEADGDRPGRCSAIHIKVHGVAGDEDTLLHVRDRVESIWKSFLIDHPQAALSPVEVKTWRQQQEALITPIMAQRTLVIIMFGIISLVAVVLVFVLFYTIVMQKTKDIGVLKAIGASSGGVAQIFLGYGAAVGLVGSAIGICLGYVFVRNINPIHDWVGRTFGLVIWNREWFMFDKIPNQVEVIPTIVIVCSAIAAGIIGALLPAYLAGRMQPVEALRYE